MERIKANLAECQSFLFSVSFIKIAGLSLIYDDIKKALKRGASGRVITSTYQNFTDIESLRRLKCLSDEFGREVFDCRLDFESFMTSSGRARGFHVKGYLFDFGTRREVVIGSSNLTRFALLRNIEWDLLVTENREMTPIYDEAAADFESLWDCTEKLDDGMIEKYSKHLNYAIERWDMDYEDLSRAAVKPNFMQRRALKELSRFRQMGVSRALVVSAAGSGKTYLAAFDALNFEPERLLYVVHEGSILEKSLSTFMEVFGATKTYGRFTGAGKDFDADFIFSTNISVAGHLESFKKDEFDYIIIDECHHATAESYKKVMDYFTPEFLLGLTATPERMDNEDVFGLFDGNVPYELRLRDAIVNELVVPFKYFGIRDEAIDYSSSNSNLRGLDLDYSDDRHCQFIVGEIEKRRPEGKLKAIAFCRSREHARMMSESMGEYYHTAYLSGLNTVGERIRAYDDLQSDDESKTEILFTVDILNEGVDIPAINMVLFLRPTDSSTVFIQQLGRGLRKYENKKFVTVLDLIGNNYRRSLQIAFALCSVGQNLVFDKPTMIDLVRHDFIPLGLKEYGVEISIDEKSQEEILNSIERENLNSFSYLKQDYKNFKIYVGSPTYPKHMDYLISDCAPDLTRFLSSRSIGKLNRSYYNFLKSVGEEELPEFSEKETDFLGELSSYLPLVRKHEYLIVKGIMEGVDTYALMDEYLSVNIPGYEKKELDHALKYFGECVKREGDRLFPTVTFTEDMTEYLRDLIDYGLERFDMEYEDERDFKCGLFYRMDQVQLKLLRNPSDIFRGTYYVEGKVIIFASLHKDASVEERLKYADKFLDEHTFQWESMVDISASDLEKIEMSDCAYLFIRKVKSEFGQTLPFTFVGKGNMKNPRMQTKTDAKSGKRHVTYLYDIELFEPLSDSMAFDFGLQD
ncbi:MAG: DUF3427 domain-containing protein [Clostridia bacterium]|nr:DUF3427 domain-containing protein [Clostridia bacterium]